MHFYLFLLVFLILAHSGGAVEYTDFISPVGLGFPNECPVYDTKQFDGEAPVMLELWRMRRIPSLLSLPGQLWPGVVASERVLLMDQIDIWTVCKQMTYAKLNCYK